MDTKKKIFHCYKMFLLIQGIRIVKGGVREEGGSRGLISFDEIPILQNGVRKKSSDVKTPTSSDPKRKGTTVVLKVRGVL